MSSHAYKKVKREPPTFSFVKAVTENGDGWWYSSHLPPQIRGTQAVYESTPDAHDYALMSLMEQGHLPRVQS